MSNGYRFILVAVGGIAILITLFMGAYFGSLYAPDKKQYQTVGSNSGTQQGYDGPSESLRDIAGVDSRIERIIANPQPKSGQDHEKRDLAAQEAMAVWALWMVGISVLTLIVSTFGLLALLKTIRQSQDAIDKAQDANDIAREGMRPWLDIDIQFTRVCIEGEYLRIFYKAFINNIGNSPAIDQSYTYAEILPDGDNSMIKRILHEDNGSGGTVILPRARDESDGSINYLKTDWKFFPSTQGEEQILRLPDLCFRTSYRWAGEKVRHKTGALFNVRWVRPDGETAGLRLSALERSISDEPLQMVFKRTRISVTT